MPAALDWVHSFARKACAPAAPTARISDLRSLNALGMQPTVHITDDAVVSITLSCPMCGQPITRRRPAFPGERPRQSHLPVGWDCAALHATWVRPDLYEQARVTRLIADVNAFLHPDAQANCGEHVWIHTETMPEFSATHCARCNSIGYSPATPS